MIIVRYVGDIVVDFEHDADAPRLWARDVGAVARVRADIPSGKAPA